MVIFTLLKKTAFVIAADESMIRYAVKKHFPDAINENKINAGDNFANKYLEKLIQVPFRIPALGEVEACIYIMLLMVGSVLPDENANYKKLREEGLTRIKKPWNVQSFTVDDVKGILGNDYEKCSSEVLIATQICHLLAQHTEGNPRKIKRFINMLLLRYEIAKNRGFGDKLELAILAKMMLVEYYEPDFYKALPDYTRIERAVHGQDSWTREIQLEIPVSDSELWKSQVSTIERMLKFLTGDIWEICFTSRTWCFSVPEEMGEKSNKYDKVSLFSGGMDSLISTINLMEDEKDTLLISHDAQKKYHK